VISEYFFAFRKFSETITASAEKHLSAQLQALQTGDRLIKQGADFFIET
jgi:hypothetical protein